MPTAPAARAIAVDQREGVTPGKRSPFEQERGPRADRAVPLRPPRDLDLREPDVRLGGPDRDVAIARSVVLQVAAIPLRVSPDHNLASLLQGKFANGIGQLDGDPRIGCEGTARAEFEPAQSFRPLILEAELFDQLIDPRIGIEGAPVRSLSEGHHRLASRPLGIEQLPEGGLQNPRSAVGHRAAGERVVVYPAPQHRRALGQVRSIGPVQRRAGFERFDTHASSGRHVVVALLGLGLGAGVRAQAEMDGHGQQAHQMAA